MSDLIDRAEAARRFPTNTCAASRHAEQIGVALVRDEPYPMLDEEPAYCGESILSVVASLWEARTEIERLTAERDDLRDVLLRGGFVPCGIPACNCGSWHHRYGLPERMQEIKDALAEAGHELSNANGNLTLNALKALVAERDELRRQLAEAEQDARRYRWLRDNGSDSRVCQKDGYGGYELRWNSALDAAIDAAMGLTRPAEES